MNQARVALFSDYFPPGFAAGGTPLSVSRIVVQNESEEVRVFTRDRDLGSGNPYPNLIPRHWRTYGDALAAYLRPGFRDLRWTIAQLSSWQPDLYYFNSLHSPWYTLLPALLRRSRLMPKAPILIAPRGECSAGASRIRGIKKRIAKPLVRWLVGMDVVWHASSPLEAQDIRIWWGGKLPASHQILISADPAPKPADDPSAGSKSRVPHVVFASRIHPMKGLDIAIDMLMETQAPVRFSIYGAISDTAYWSVCAERLRHLPNNVAVDFHGAYQPGQVSGIFGAADLLVLPTRGENFGHVIAEAMSVGCPVLISDQTLWTELVKSSGGCAGSGTKMEQFLSEFVNLTLEQRTALRSSTLGAYAAWYSHQSDSRMLFSAALELSKK